MLPMPGMHVRACCSASWFRRAREGLPMRSRRSLISRRLRGAASSVPTRSWPRPTRAVRGGERSRQGAGLRPQAASLGDPEGAFFLSVLLTNEYLGYMNANGKSDDTRYFQLAKRPLSERSIDTEALGCSVLVCGQGFPMAVMLALKAAATTGTATGSAC